MRHNASRLDNLICWECVLDTDKCNLSTLWTHLHRRTFFLLFFSLSRLLFTFMNFHSIPPKIGSDDSLCHNFGIVVLKCVRAVVAVVVLCVSGRAIQIGFKMFEQKRNVANVEVVRKNRHLSPVSNITILWAKDESFVILHTLTHSAFCLKLTGNCHTWQR